VPYFSIHCSWAQLIFFKSIVIDRIFLKAETSFESEILNLIFQYTILLPTEFNLTSALCLLYEFRQYQLFKNRVQFP